jgi:peptide/nickel transport system permease protein
MMSGGARSAPPSLLGRFARGEPLGLAALLVLALIAAVAIAAPLIAPQDPFDPGALDIMDSELPPFFAAGADPRYLLGTDGQGRDMLSALLYGAQLSLLIGVAAVAFQAILGVTLGVAAGYFGGRLDALVMRLADVQLALSTLMVAIVALALFRTAFGAESFGHWAAPLLIVVIGLAEWPFLARTARAAVIAEMGRDHVRAARALGLTPGQIVRRHILPNALSPLIVIGAAQVGAAIMAEAALSFLGLGMPVTTPSLGTLIRSGFDLLFSGAWWVTILPAILLVAILLCVNLVGDALRDALDPRGRARA